MSIALTSAFSAAGVKRAAAKAPAVGGGLTPSEVFNLIVPAYHRQQALQEHVYRFFGIDPGKPSFQKAGPTPTGVGRTRPTPTSSSNLPPTARPTATDTEPPLPTEIITPTQTLAPTSTLTNTPTKVPTETQAPTSATQPCTGSGCITPTPPEPTATSIPSGTPTPEPTATPPITATETVTAAPSIPGGIDSLVQLRLGERLDWIAGGNPFTLTWGIDGLPYLPPRLVLALTLPDGFTPLGVPDGSWNPETHTLTLPLSALGGWTGVEVSPDVVGPFTLHAELYRNGALLASRDVTISQEWLTRVGVGGGVARGLRDQVRANFPAGALPEAVRVHIRAPKADALPYSLSGSPFEITAVGEADGQEIHHFTQPITITMSYSDTQIQGDESGMTLFYYDEQAGTWMPMASQVETQTNTLTGWSDHLSFFDGSVQDWEAARLPSLKSFQTSSFTGAASYSFPIEVPQGPGGLQPSVSLSYSSQTVDSASGTTQAEWVGMGWSLDTGYIQRNMNGNPDSTGNDLFTINANGVSGEMLKGSDGYYHTEDETFWRIQFDTGNDIWYAWDKTGNEYIFGLAIGATHDHRARYPIFNTLPDPCDADILTWKWTLTKIRNIYGQELTFLYNKTLKVLSYQPPGCGSVHTYDFDAAMVPAEIDYPNYAYRVVFSQDNNRTDYDSAWDDGHSRTFYNKSKLNEIRIEHNLDLLDEDFTNTDLVRRYVLTYASSSGFIFPNYQWSAGGKTLTLLQIQEYGANGGSLPATTFTYGDGMHLTQGTNGYGGTVNYTYDSWNEIHNPDGKTTGQDFNGLCPGSTGSWQAASGQVECGTRGQRNVLDIHGASGGTAKRTLEQGLLHPGGEYQLDLIGVTSVGSGDVISLGYGDGVSSYYPPEGVFSINNWSAQDLTLSFFLPATATYIPAGGKVALLIKCNSACLISKAYTHWLPTYYRVTAQQTVDGVTGQSSTSYTRYDGPATNDAEHSAAVGVSDVPAYSEYRGNAMVEVKSPANADGENLITTSFYNQRDDGKGNGVTTITHKEDFVEPFESTDWANYYSLNWGYNGAQPTFERVTGDGAAKVTNPAADWTRAFYRSAYSIHDGNAMIVQFRLDVTATQQTILALNSADGGGYWRWGIKQINSTLYVQTCTASSGCDAVTGSSLLSGIIPDHWYVLMLIVDPVIADPYDNQHFLMRVWDRDNPANVGRYEADLTTGGWDDLNWRFMSKVNNGSVWLDEYSEGKVYSLSESVYQTITLFDGISGGTYPDIVPIRAGYQVQWVRPYQSKSMTFEGDSTWNGTLTSNDYNTADQGNAQYGNLTRVVESSWNAANNRWDDYRLTRTLFYPNAGSVYLVGLPAIVKKYSCNATDYNGACSANYVEGHLTGSQWSIYDANTSFDQAPTTGILAKQRVLLRCNGTCATTTEYFSDTAFAYDGYGNRTTTTVYTGEGWYTNGFGQGTARSSYTCYGGGGTLNGNTCAEDYYHTYDLWERNTAPTTPHWTQMTYSGVAVYNTSITGYRLGVPVSIIDPNSVTTSAEYDEFGRITAIIRYSDDHTNPTMRMSYYDTSSPMYTEAQQRITGTTYAKIRKYYTGLGQLLQTEVVAATVNGTSQDILVDKWYDATGQVWKTSVPYAVSTSSGFHNRDSSKTYSAYNTYDVLGRPEYVYATDGTHTSYVYKDLETEVTDANNYTTHTTVDVWGRTTYVVPPPSTGASVHYTSYDTQNHLTQVVYGNAPSNYTYDSAGRKLTMDDPTWGTGTTLTTPWATSATRMTPNTSASACITTA